MTYLSKTPTRKAAPRIMSTLGHTIFLREDKKKKGIYTILLRTLILALLAFTQVLLEEGKYPYEWLVKT